MLENRTNLQAAFTDALPTINARLLLTLSVGTARAQKPDLGERKAPRMRPQCQQQRHRGGVRRRIELTKSVYAIATACAKHAEIITYLNA